MNCFTRSMLAILILYYLPCGSTGHSMATQPITLALLPIVTAGLQQPVYLAQPVGEAKRLFVVERAGRIRIVQEGKLLEQPFLDITSRVRSAGQEQGLLGLAFHPAYTKNGRYFLHYTRAQDGASVVSEFQVSDQPNVSTASERVLLVIPDPYPNHNGGMVEFGPDGFLYIALGDGGAGGDPENRGQNLQELLGKLLRIDVDRGALYAIPSDNPFATSGGRPEIYAWGFRNPWRFSFDRLTGQLWAGDVGQNKWEEIDIVQLGGNYGWRIMEGTHCYAPPVGCPTKGLIGPVAEYQNDGTRCSIIGGYVYRGSGTSTLQGTYVYGDFCSGEIFGLREGSQRTVLSTSLPISSFGQDQSGEVYVVGLNGTVHRIVESTR